MPVPRSLGPGALSIFTAESVPLTVAAVVAVGEHLKQAGEFPTGVPEGGVPGERPPQGGSGSHDKVMATADVGPFMRSTAVN